MVRYPAVKREWDSLGYIRTIGASLRRRLRSAPFETLTSRAPVSVEEYIHRSWQIVLSSGTEVASDEVVVLIRAAAIRENTYINAWYSAVVERAGRWRWAQKKDFEALERLARQIESARPLETRPGHVWPGSHYSARKPGFGVGLVDVAERPAG
jgi:hypothetical protein